MLLDLAGRSHRERIGELDEAWDGKPGQQLGHTRAHFLDGECTTAAQDDGEHHFLSGDRIRDAVAGGKLDGVEREDRVLNLVR